MEMACSNSLSDKNKKRALSFSSSLFIVLFFLLLLYPLAGKIFDKNIVLRGMTATIEITEPTIGEVLAGDYQSQIGSYIDENFWGRKLLIKIRSQGLYSLFNTSPNKNVLIGKGKYLYEPMYINEELALYETVSDNYYADLIEKIEDLQELLVAEGKELYIFLTPSKAYFCKEYIPGYFDLFTDNEKRNNYQMLTAYLAESDLLYFDSHQFIDSYSEDDMDYPVFYSTGIHWSRPWACRAALEFKKYISENSKWNLSTLTQTIEEGPGPQWSEEDLYQTLNLISGTGRTQYYNSSLEILEEGDHPNVFLRGGSFMGQSLSALIDAGTFGEDVCFENYYWFKNRYSESGTLSSFTAYEEFEQMGDLLSKSDILILECNESVSNLSWGFIDYVLEHPEFLLYPEE